MSYFDHVQCSNCGGRIDPERLQGNPGEPLSCPYCRQEMPLTDLFGLKDEFSEADGPNVGIDDLVHGYGQGSTWIEEIDGKLPSQRKASSGPAAKGKGGDALRALGKKGAAKKAAPPPAPSRPNMMVPVKKADDVEEAEAEEVEPDRPRRRNPHKRPKSALEALKQMKKR